MAATVPEEGPQEPFSRDSSTWSGDAEGGEAR
jgi:hypothetical protein